MTLQELFQRVLINSGQFQYSPDKVELNVDPFKVLVEMCLGIYNGYVPITKHLFKEITAPRQYTFTDMNTPEGIPEWISKIQPIRISGVVPYYLKEYNVSKQTAIKEELPFEYRQPVLTVVVAAEYDILAVYNHKLTYIDDSDQREWEIKTVSDNEDEFIDLVTAKFLIGLGRSRRAFTVQDLPLLTDASDLVSEGKEMEEAAMEELKEEKGRWYLAWGG